MRSKLVINKTHISNQGRICGVCFGLIPCVREWDRDQEEWRFLPKNRRNSVDAREPKIANVIDSVYAEQYPLQYNQCFPYRICRQCFTLMTTNEKTEKDIVTRNIPTLTHTNKDVRRY